MIQAGIQSTFVELKGSTTETSLREDLKILIEANCFSFTPWMEEKFTNELNENIEAIFLNENFVSFPYLDIV